MVVKNKVVKTCKLCGGKMKPWALDVCPECRQTIMREMGRKGGQTTKATYGHDFYVEIGRRGGLKMKQRELE